MKLIALILVFSFLAGCTTFKPIGMSSMQPEEHLDLGKVIRPGNGVRIVTKDGKKHEFRVTDVTSDHIAGRTYTPREKNIEIPIMDIATIEKQKISIIKTLLFVIGTPVLVITTRIALYGPFGA